MGRSRWMWVTVLSGLERGRAVEVGGAAVTIGAGAGCAIQLSDPDVAPLHASVRCGPDDGCELVPLDLYATLTLDGEPVTATVPLRAGQRIVVGDVALELRERPPADPDPEMEPALAAALGSDGAHADDDLGGWAPIERRRLRRATAIALAALAVAVLAGVLALTGVLGGDDEPDVAAIVEGTAPGTVRVIARAASEEGSGSGWVLDAREGLVVTNFHVVNGADQVAVAVDGAERTAEVVGAAPCDDLALVRLEEIDGLRALRLAPSGSIRQGEPVVAVGYAAGAGDADRLTSTTGVVSVPSQPLRAPSPDAPDFRDVVQTDAAINPGNSGGPLVDAERRLVGVNTAVLLESGGVPLQNIGYAIGVDRVRAVTGELREERSTGWIGTGLEFPDPRALRRRGLPAGVATLGAVEGTPADDAGLARRSVLITSVDGRRMDGSLRTWCEATDAKRSGDAVVLGVASRDGERRRVRIRMA